MTCDSVWTAWLSFGWQVLTGVSSVGRSQQPPICLDGGRRVECEAAFVYCPPNSSIAEPLWIDFWI